jgi:hypothetical protein
MFGNDRLAKPRTISLVLALIIAIVVFALTKTSAMATYVIALMTLVMLIITSFTGSIWATRGKQENITIFSMFWGLIIGAVIPFLLSTFLQGGISALTKLFLD